MRTFGPLSKSFILEVPKIVVEGEDGTEESKSQREFTEEEEEEEEDSVSDNGDKEKNEAENTGAVSQAKPSRWHSKQIRDRLLRAVARRDGDKVTLLLPLAPVYGQRERDPGDAIRSWIRTHTRGSRWYASEPVREQYLAYPFRSVATQTDSSITASSLPPLSFSKGDGDEDDDEDSVSSAPSSSASRWDKLVDVEMNGLWVSLSVWRNKRRYEYVRIRNCEYVRKVVDVLIQQPLLPQSPPHHHHHSVFPGRPTTQYYPRVV